MATSQTKDSYWDEQRVITFLNRNGLVARTESGDASFLSWEAIAIDIIILYCGVVWELSQIVSIVCLGSGGVGVLFFFFLGMGSSDDVGSIGCGADVDGDGDDDNGACCGGCIE